MPDLSGQDDRGTLGAPADRAAGAAAPVGGPSRRPRVFVVSGPSGAGKGTLIEGILPRFPQLELAISATTRPMRHHEVDGLQYHFLGPQEFERRVAAGDFLEHVTFAGNRYGTLRDEVDRRLADGRSVVLEIELAGARSVRGRLPDAVAIFIAASREERRRRLICRGTESEQEIEARLATGDEEIAAAGEFPNVIVNEADVEAAVEELARVVAASTSAAPSPPPAPEPAN